MTTLINIVGSVALLLWGIRMVRTAVTRSFGAELRWLVANALADRLKALLSGVVATTCLQSSTATAMLVVSFANSGAITGAMALAILLGADIGTTLVVQVFTQRVEVLSPLLIASGVIIFLSSEKARYRNIGRGLLGLGLITLALQGISSAAKPLAASNVTESIVSASASEPLLMIIVTAAITLVVHSSVAVVLLVSAFAGAEAVSFEQAMILVLGANLGGGLLPVMATWLQPPSARVPAIANAAIRGMGVLLVVPASGVLASYGVHSGLDGQLLVAHFHTLFNLVLALIALPWVTTIIAIVTRFFPEHASPLATQLKTNLQEDALDSPSVALACATRETLRIGDAIEDMLERSFDVFRDDNSEQRKRVEAMDDEVDQLHDGVKLYLARLMREELDDDESSRAIEILGFATNLEHIGDIIDKNLMELAAKKKRAKAVFSEEGLEELGSFHVEVKDNLQRAIHVFMTGDVQLARELLAQKASIREKERQSIERHFERIGRGTAQSIDSSSLHLDILRDLKRINSHITSVAYPILERAGELAATRLLDTDTG